MYDKVCIDSHRYGRPNGQRKGLVMSRVQLALNVTDVEAAAEYYGKLFGAEPAKRRRGYVNFAIEDPPLKLVLIENATGGSINHLGVEVDTTDAVMAADRRLGGEGLDTNVEEQVACCYAVQDKTWSKDPDGVDWEIYSVLADADVMSESEDGACCGDVAGEAPETGETASACC